MKIEFSKLANPTPEIADAFSQWDNDPALVHLMRPNQNQADLEKQTVVDIDALSDRMNHQTNYLIFLDGQLVGEMSFQKDPPHLYKKETNTAWIGITIGEASARGKGLGLRAMQFLEDEIKKAGFNRIELGVFEFNESAHKLYTKMGYAEIGRISDFTFWKDKMWADIRMEKYL